MSKFNSHPAGDFFAAMIKDQREAAKKKKRRALDDVNGADPLDDELAGTTGGITDTQNKDKVPGIMDDADEDDSDSKDKDDKGNPFAKKDGDDKTESATDDADDSDDDKKDDDKKTDDGKTESATDDVGDDDDSDAADYADADIDLQVAAALHQFAETEEEDLDDGETLADRLQALIVGVVDPDFNGDIDSDASDLIAVAMESAGDYLADKGVAEADIDALLNAGDVDAADRVQELLANKLPSDADGIADDIDDHAFGDDAPIDPDAVFDATMVTAVRNGKKVRIKKRLSGRVRLSAKQKLAIRKMQKKSHSARAQMKRLKSDKIRARLFGKK
jgi:hypothetical protein